jgi:hypothetical protein
MATSNGSSASRNACSSATSNFDVTTIWWRFSSPGPPGAWAGGLAHFGLHLGQHARHYPVALGMAAELALGAETVESRADRRNGDGGHHENISAVSVS